MMPTHRNSAPETMPCDTIWNTPPATPCVVPAKMPMVTKPICATEEYAISFFMSSCIKATSEV